MNYYIIPRNNCNITFCLSTTNELLDDEMSFSAKNVDKMRQKEQFTDLMSLVNPYEYVYSIIPGYSKSISQMNVSSHLFYEFVELMTFWEICFSNEILSNVDNRIIDELRQFFPLNKEITQLGLYDFTCNINADFSQQQQYIKNVATALYKILTTMGHKGNLIMKLNKCTYKPIVEIIYVLSSMFEKTFIVKPSIGNVFASDMYLVCKCFNPTVYENINILNNYINSINIYIKSLIQNRLPLYFWCKLDEANVIIKQSQIEHLVSLAHLGCSKLKDDKLESIKRTHIFKSTMWCEKHNIPYNDFVCETNIFMNPKLNA